MTELWMKLLWRCFSSSFSERLKPFPSQGFAGKDTEERATAGCSKPRVACLSFYRTWYDDTFLYHQEIPCVEASLQNLAVCFMEKIYLCLLFFFHHFKLLSFFSFPASFSCCHLLFTPLDEALNQKNEREICIEIFSFLKLKEDASYEGKSPVEFSFPVKILLPSWSPDPLHLTDGTCQPSRLCFLSDSS